MTEQNTINWTDLRKQADDATKPVPDGWYEVIVEKAERKPASTGAEMVAAQFKIETGAHAGRTLFTNFVFSPEKAFALNMFFRNMEALGVGPDFFAQLQEQQLSAEACMVRLAEAITGRRVKVETATRQYQGQDRNEIKNMTPVAGQGAPVVGSGVQGGPPGLPPSTAPAVTPALSTTTPAGADPSAPPALPY